MAEAGAPRWMKTINMFRRFYYDRAADYRRTPHPGADGRQRHAILCTSSHPRDRG